MSIINGIVITTFEDVGPFPVINLSSLDEESTFKLSVVGMTLLSMGSEDSLTQRHYRLHGPIPIPGVDKFEVLSMSFNVSTTESRDERITQGGRESTLFVIFDTAYRSKIALLHNILEKNIKLSLSPIKTETELRDQTLIEPILNNIRAIVASTDTSSLTQSPDIAESPSLSAVEEIFSKQEAVLKKPVIFYDIDQNGDLKIVTDLHGIESRPLLLVVNTDSKEILVIKQNGVNPRTAYKLRSAASNLNSKHFKSKYKVKDLTDPLEVMMKFKKLQQLLE